MNRFRKIGLSFILLFLINSILFSQSDSGLQILSDSIDALKKDDFHKSIRLLDNYKVDCQNNQNILCHKDSILILEASIYLNGAKKYQFINVDSARILIDKAKQIYSDKNMSSKIHEAQFISGWIYFKDGTMKEGIQEFNHYITYHKSKGNSYQVALGEYRKASCFRRIGEQDSTITYLHKAISTFEQLNKTTDLANCYHIFGIVYTSLKQFDIAQKYLDDGLAIHRKDKNLPGQAKLLTGLGNNTYAEGDTLGCINYYRKAGKISRNENIISGIYVNYYNTANAFYQLAEYDSALVYVDKANEYRNQLGKRHRYMIHYKKGSIYIEKEKFREGINLLENAYLDALDLNAYIDARDMAHYLSRGYKNISDFEQAYTYAQKFAELKDSVITIESNKTINQLEAKYEAEKREIQIDNLQLINSNQLKMLIAGGLALTLISLLLFFLYTLYNRVNSQKEVISKSLKEKDLLLREIHHRVKNNLQLVSSLLTLQGRSIDDKNAQQAIMEGKSRVRSMALIHHDLYNRENLTGIGAKEYIEKLSKELFDTYQIDQENLKLNLDIDDTDIDVDIMVPLGLIINELVTNSLKYGFPDSKRGTINIILKENKSQLKLIVSDNGIGYDESKVREGSFGKTLISALTAQLEGTITQKIDDGTSVEIIFEKE